MNREEKPASINEPTFDSQFRIAYLDAALRAAADRVVLRLAFWTDQINDMRRMLDE